MQNNIPLALADELTPLFQDIFSDSEIAKNFSSRRTKTACIINGAIAPYYQHVLVQAMKAGPFSVAIDGSSDSGVEKMNPLTVRIFNEKSGIVHTQVLDICLSSRSTVEGIFSKMQDALPSSSMKYLGLIALGSQLIVPQ